MVSTILRREFTYDQKQGTCAEVRGHQSVVVFLIIQLQKHLSFILTEHFCYFSILMLPTPTAQQTLTASRERWTLMVMVWFLFSNSLHKQCRLIFKNSFQHLEHFLIGRRTGRCVQYYNDTFKTCEVQTWCPIERFAAVQ